MRRPPRSLANSVQAASGKLAAHVGNLEIEKCKNLCEDGQVTKAVDLLNLLVQQGCHVPHNLFYCVLKRCIAKKDLVLGRRVHALSDENGYEGNAFLATHLIGLYASHGRPKDAMRVFSKVRQPSAQNWSSIILAYARHGEPTQAIALYQQLRESSVKPDNHIFGAVLQACATAGALAVGKDVHAHIRASAVKPDMFVQTCLLDMYTKCGMAHEALRLYTSMLQEGISEFSSLTFVRLLQACASVGVAALHQGKQLHKQIDQLGVQADVVVGASLVNMYAKCGSLKDAQTVFDRLLQKNVVTWTSMIAGYAQQGMGKEALSLYSSMQQEGITPPNSVTYACLLQACGSVGVAALNQGKQLHGEIETRGWQVDVVVGNSLIDMYAKCGSLEDARGVFDRLPHRDVVTWTAMITGYAQHGMGQEALSLYSSMQEEGIIIPNAVTFVAVLQACASTAALHQGKQVHKQIEGRGFQHDVVVGNSLVNMYAKCSSLQDARRVFDGLPKKDVVTWNAMIAGYAHQGMGLEALSLYSSMQQEGILPPNSVTFVCLLQASAGIGVAALKQGQQLHAQIEERGLQADVVVGNSLVNMYAKCGSLEDARRVFDRLAHRDSVTWNALIAGYAQQGMGEEALSLSDSMQQEGITPDSVTFVCLLQACAGIGVAGLHHGKQLHSQIAKRGLQDDAVVSSSLIHMYSKCRSLEDAQRVFDRLSRKDVVLWTSMIAGYAQQGMGEEALSLYSLMEQEGITPPDSITFACLLQACASVGAAAQQQGKQLHVQIEERGLQADVVVGANLVNMYAKCGSLEDAHRVFDKLPHKNVVTWTAMIAGYAQQGMGQEALRLYTSMQQEGINAPNSITFVCLLQACASAAALPLGIQLHAQIEERGLQADVVVGSSLANMYAKCGRLDIAQEVFDSLAERDIVAWNALIAGYARQGDSEVVFDLVERMREEGIQPNSITCLSVLTVCSHGGVVEKGRKHFEAMSTDFGISPTLEHYSCMIDLLGRAGHLDEAVLMAKTMPFEPNVAVWLTLLSACQKWRHVEIGRQAFEFAVRLDEKDAAAYVLMSNIYADAEMWKEAKEMQATRLACGAYKQPGQSWWADVDGLLHTFAVGDTKHPEIGVT